MKHLPTLVCCALLLGFWLPQDTLRAAETAPRTAPKEPLRVGVIIALGIGHRHEARPTYKMLQRVTAAVSAYRQKRAKYILFCGGHTTGHISEADEMKIMAQALGVPARAILVENGSISTGQNARNAARLVGRKRFRSALLVTHKSHMDRAMGHFKKRVPRLRRIYKLYADDFAPSRIDITLTHPSPSWTHIRPWWFMGNPEPSTSWETLWFSTAPNAPWLAP